MATQLPPNATSLSDQATDCGSPINDDDPHAALELVKDAIVLHDTGARKTTLERGHYKVNFTTAHDDWDAQHAVALTCRTNHVTPDARNPGASVKTYATCWIEPLDVAREIVTDHFSPDAFEGFTQKKEEERY